MKRQIALILTMMILACSRGFVFAQSDKTTSLTNYFITKPKTITQWLKDKQTSSTLTSYTSPKKILEGGNIFAEQYLVAIWRELDVMYQALGGYRQGLISAQAKLAPGGSTSDCAGLTDLDIVALMTKSNQFVDRMSVYSTITLDTFDQATLDRACNRRTACVGGSARTAYSSLTAAQVKWPVCSDVVASQFLMTYDTQLGLANFDLINQYNNIFMDGSGTNAPFDLGVDIHTIIEHHVERLVKPVDSTKTVDPLATVKSAKVTGLPDELITSTQQLLTALEIDTTVDPRQDAQIASLIGQLTTVSSSSTSVPTGSILNACIDPLIAQQNISNILQQLQQTQQATQQYNVSLNTNQSLNNAINGTLDPATLTAQAVRLSATNNPDRTIELAVSIPASLADNGAGNDLANINDADLPPVVAGGSQKQTINVETALSSTGKVDPMKQCASSCVQKYSQKSSCVQDCKAKGDIGGLLNMRACEQQCFNAKIACSAACFCQYQGSTTPTTGEVKKVHELFELRWCVVPTNKLRNPVDSSCIRTDPETGVVKGPSIECLLDKTIEQGTYNRESGQGGLRVKPREWFELPNKFDLTKMIRFTVGVTNSPIRKDPSKTKDINESLAKNNYNQTTSTSPALLNSQVAGQTQEQLGDWINNQIELRKSIAAQAKAIEQIIQK